MSHIRVILEGALIAARDRVAPSARSVRLTYDDAYEGAHMSLHVCAGDVGDYAWRAEVVGEGALLTFFVQSAKGAVHALEALGEGFFGKVPFYRRQRRQVHRRMFKLARDLSSRRWGEVSEGAPLDALERLRGLFPGAPLLVGVSRRVQTRAQDPEARATVVASPRQRVLRLRFAALVPTRLEGDTPTLHRAAPFSPSQGVFWLDGMTPQALAAFEARAQTTAADALASLPPYARAPQPITEAAEGGASNGESLGMCAEAGCQNVDLGFLACDVFSGCDGADGCDVGGCDL